MRPTQFGVYPFGVKVYGALCTLRVRTGKIFFYFVHCVYDDVDKKIKIFLFVRCVYRAMYAFHICPKYAQLSSRSWLDNTRKGHNLFSNYFNSFYIFVSFFIYLYVNTE